MLCGITYFFVHFLLEVTCYSVLYNALGPESTFYIILVYDFFAFAVQGLIGEFSNAHKDFDIGSFGVCLLFIGILLYSDDRFLYTVSIFFIAFGNAFVHEAGAVSCAVTGNGKMFPSALFVAGGSFGVVTGQLLGGLSGVHKWFLLLILATMEILILCTNKHWLSGNYVSSRYHLTEPSVSDLSVIIISVSVVAVRSLISYAIPSSWRTDLWHTCALFAAMGTGKACGGFFADRFGARCASLACIILSIPFLVLGGRNMAVSLIGIFLFSMLMPVTFAALLSVIDSPGTAFGFTTIGLFLGTLPELTGTVNILAELYLPMIILLSVLSAAMLHKILK